MTSGVSREKILIIFILLIDKIKFRKLIFLFSIAGKIADSWMALSGF